MHFNVLLGRNTPAPDHLVRIPPGGGLKSERAHSPVMGGGSTTVEGPKNEGTSPDVVTGVLRSPGCVSDGGGSSTAEQAAAGTGLPPLSTAILFVLYRHVSKLSTLKWCAAAADSVNKKAEA